MIIIGSSKTIRTADVRCTATSAKLTGCQFLFQLQDEHDNVLKHTCHIKHYNISDSNHKNIAFIGTNDSSFINASKLSGQLDPYQVDHCVGYDKPNEVLHQFMLCINLLKPNVFFTYHQI